jgi:peptidoglycan/LPS O-acetylase OafA/YrhL
LPYFESNTKLLKPPSQEIIPTVHKNTHLEALRGVLALMVLFSHIHLIRFYFGKSEAYNHPIIYHLGRIAVTGFFVLSGYLITYSILKRREAGNWKVSGFYTARIFRIWPLYYTVILLALFVLPHISALHFMLPPSVTDVRTATEYYGYYIGFLPQLPLLDRAVLPFAEPSWSIGVEEIFYLIIPWVVLSSGQKLGKWLLVFLIAFLSLKYMAMFTHFPGRQMARLLQFYRYDSIALGCLAGVMHYHKSKIFHVIGNRQLVATALFTVLLFANLERKSRDYFPFAICFVVIIAYLVNKNHTFKSPKWLVYIGTISYSLYLTHEIAIVYLVNKDVDQRSMPLMYALAVVGAIGLASVFYFLIERPFMRWRKLPGT